MKHLVAITTAAALAMTAATATPAAAWGKNEQQFLGALLGMAVIGAVINDANKSNAQPRPAPPPSNNWGGHNNNNDWNTRPSRGWEDRTTWLPGSCLRSVRLNSGTREVVSAQCLRDEGVTARLPTNCAFDIRTDWGTQRVYGTSCLSDAGFRVARR